MHHLRTNFLISYEDWLKEYKKIDDFDSSKNYEVQDVVNQLKINKSHLFTDYIRYGLIMRKIKMNYNKGVAWGDYSEKNNLLGEKQTNRYINLADLNQFPLFFRLYDCSVNNLASIAPKIYTYLKLNKEEGEIWKNIKWKK